MKKILIIEDDKKLAGGIMLALRKEYACSMAHSLASARKDFDVTQFDLILLDVNFPDGNGMDYLVEIRRKSAVPVIMLTACCMEMDIVSGLEQGANDYITKPFSLMVLRARIEKAFGRGEARRRSIYEADGFCFDFERMFFSRDGQEIVLSRTEQKLLRHLVENRGITLSRGRLVDAVWTDGAAYVDENALSVAVKRLRDKLEPCPQKPAYLQTVYGIGYVWQEGGRP